MDAPFQPNLNLVRRKDGVYPMIWAVNKRDADLVKVLASRPFESKLQKLVKEKKKSPVLIATQHEQIEILKILLEGGWDPNSGV